MLVSEEVGFFLGGGFGFGRWCFVGLAVVGLVSVAFQDKAVGCVDRHRYLFV